MSYLGRILIPVASVLLISGCVSSVKQQQESLLGQWRIVDIEKQVITNNKALLTFSSEGKVFGNNGCNNLIATYKPVHDHLNLSDVATTKKYCGGSAGQDEKAFTLAINKIEHFLVKKDRLFLTDEQDLPIITLIR